MQGASCCESCVADGGRGEGVVAWVQDVQMRGAAPGSVSLLGREAGTGARGCGDGLTVVLVDGGQALRWR